MAIATKAQEEVLKAWFIQPGGFWAQYGGNYCTPTQKGGRGAALKIIYKINPDEEKRKKMLAKRKAQLRACDQEAQKGEFVARWPLCTSYLNQNRHEDEIESKLYTAEPIQLKTCEYDGCHYEVHGKNYKTCAKHVAFKESNEFISNQLKKIGLNKLPDEGIKEFRMRCKTYYQENLA